MFNLADFLYCIGNPSAWDHYDDGMSERMRRAAAEIERLQEQLSHAVPAIEQLTKEREVYRTRWLASEVELRLALEARAHEQSGESK